jgi:hypothetical protein
MPTKTNDGGPAFPRTYSSGEAAQTGMSLRDYFAAKAIQGLFAAGEASSPCILVDPKMSHSQKRCMTEDEFSACAYSYADAMLKAREAGE